MRKGNSRKLRVITMQNCVDLPIKKTIQSVPLNFRRYTSPMHRMSYVIVAHFGSKINATVLTNIFMLIAPLREVPIRELQWMFGFIRSDN